MKKKPLQQMQNVSKKADAAKEKPGKKIVSKELVEEAPIPVPVPVPVLAAASAQIVPEEEEENPANNDSVMMNVSEFDSLFRRMHDMSMDTSIRMSMPGQKHSLLRGEDEEIALLSAFD